MLPQIQDRLAIDGMVASAALPQFEVEMLESRTLQRIAAYVADNLALLDHARAEAMRSWENRAFNEMLIVSRKWLSVVQDNLEPARRLRGRPDHGIGDCHNGRSLEAR